MDGIYVIKLIETITSHQGITKFNPQPFIDLLTKLEPHNSQNAFYVELPKDPKLIVTINETDRESTKLSLRRLIRTNNVREGYKTPLAKTIKGAVVAHFGFFDSTDLTRHLRADREMNEELRNNPWDYALLAKLETRIKMNPRSVGYMALSEVVKAVPLFIIPEAINSEAITRWENRHTIYREKLRCDLPKLITEREYELMAKSARET